MLPFGFLTPSFTGPLGGPELACSSLLRHTKLHSSSSAQIPSELTHPPVPSGYPRSPARKAESSISPRPFPTAPDMIFPESKLPDKRPACARKPACPFRKNSHIFGRGAGKAAGVFSVGTTAIEFLIRGERYLFEESPAVSKKLSLTEADRVSLFLPPRRWGKRTFCLSRRTYTMIKTAEVRHVRGKKTAIQV